MGGGYILGHWESLVCGAERCWLSVLVVTGGLKPVGSFLQAHGGGPPAHVLALDRGLFPSSKQKVVILGPPGKALPSKGSKDLQAERLLGVCAHSSDTVPMSGPLLVQVNLCRLALLCALLRVKNTWRPLLLFPLVKHSGASRFRC